MLSKFLRISAGLAGAGALIAATAAHAYNAYVPTDPASISVVDTTSHQLIATVPVGNRPLGVAVSPDGSAVLVTNNTDGTVSIIDAATNKVRTTLAVGRLPNAVVVKPDGSRAYVANGGDSTVSVIDLATDAVIATIPLISARFAPGLALSPHAAAISPDGSRVYVMNIPDESVSVIDTATNRVVTTVNVQVAGEQAPPTFASIGVTPDGKSVFASNGNGFSVISTATNAITANVDLTSSNFPISPYVTTPPSFMAPSPSTIIFSPDGAHAYVNESLRGGIYVFSLPNLGFERFINATYVSSSISFGDSPIALTPDGKKIFTVGFGSAGEIDVKTGLFDAVFPVPGATIAFGSFVVSPPSPVLAAVLPGGRSITTGTTATVFATMLNTGATPLSNCSIALPLGGINGLSLHYQTTNPATNLPVGQPDVPVTIPANGSVTFVLSFEGAAAVPTLTQELSYSCDGIPTTTVITGLNTVDLLISATPVTDVIALAATVSGDGILTVPSGAEGAFAVATFNTGAPGAITVSVDTGGAALPVTATICQTDPTTAQCLAPPASTVSVSLPANSTPTFSIFVKATGAVPFDPAGTRLFVRFNDSNGVSHGVTNVAVRTGS